MGCEGSCLVHEAVHILLRFLGCLCVLCSGLLGIFCTVSVKFALRRRIGGVACKHFHLGDSCLKEILWRRSRSFNARLDLQSV